MKPALFSAFALFFLLVAATALGDTVDLDILYPILDVEYREDGAYTILPLGLDHGLVEGGLRPYFKRGDEDSFEHLGSLELLSVADSSCVLKRSWTQGDSLRSGDAVDLRFRLEPPATRQVLWELLRYGLFLADENGEIYYDFRIWIGENSTKQDSVVFAYSARVVENTLPVASEVEAVHVPISDGRLAGSSVYEAMSATTPDMIQDFFQFVYSYPNAYMGRIFSFAEIYATWLMGGAEYSPEEAMSDGLLNGPDAFRARLPDYITSIDDPATDDSWPLHWYVRARRLWSEEQHEASMEQLALFRIACENLGAPRWWELYWNARADILDWNGEEELSLAAYEEAIHSSAGDSASLAITHNNLAGAYNDLERFEEAAEHYTAALKLRGAWETPFANLDAAISWAHLARSRQGLGDYQGATEAFEISARLYGDLGDLHSLEQRYQDLSALGDMHSEHGRNREAIDAWQRGLDTARVLGWNATVADALDDMSAGHWNLGELEKAVELRLEAARLHGEEGEYYDQAYTFTNLASLHSILGKHTAATEYYRQAIESHRSREEWWDLGDVYQRLGSMEREQGLFDEAWQDLELAGEFLSEHGDADDMAQVHRERAEILEGRGDGLAADSLYALALAGYREAENGNEEARTLQWWGGSLIRRKEQARALAKLE
jgi:tetratricopeptide (TPR) repeat protein